VRKSFSFRTIEFSCLSCMQVSMSFCVIFLWFLVQFGKTNIREFSKDFKLFDCLEKRTCYGFPPWAYRAGGRRGRQPHPPSRAILVYYKNKWVNFVIPPLPPPVDNNFGKFLRKIVFDNAGTIRKSRANFFPPP
jgi:hypothetical protein